MRRFTLFFSALVLGTTAMKAQTVASFEALSLAHADTFYTNYTASGTDVGFNNGLVRFPCVYDTSWGGYWEQGFAYSNMTDSTTSGFMNQYSAKTGSGRAGSDKYAVAYCYNPATFENNIKIKLTGIAMGHPVKGFYITNSTYAYNSMRDGDGFARKFHNGDWFKLIVRGYYNGVMKPDSAGFYLANFLQPDSNNNYIVKTWEWLNLEPLGKVDSLMFTLTSSDAGSFGMNTPAYFCMDDFTTYETFDTTTPPPTLSINNTTAPAIKVYPNPAENRLYVDLASNNAAQITISNIAGTVVSTISTATAHNEINTSSLPAGMYLLQVTDEGRKATMKFVKK
ncbi:MAG: DUF4465 domain-containing protein [Taibaiella sp.]|nr:DUF4465 domain-containing protein [Taibaiella sp.]